MGTHSSGEVRHEAAARQQERRFYDAFMELGLRWEQWAERGVLVLSLTLRSPKEDGGDWLVVIRAQQDGVPVVSFTSGNTPTAALESSLNRLSNGTAKWRDDEYSQR